MRVSSLTVVLSYIGIQEVNLLAPVERLFPMACVNHLYLGARTS